MHAEYTLLFGRPKRPNGQASYCNRQRLYAKSAAKVQKKNDIHKRRLLNRHINCIFMPFFQSVVHFSRSIGYGIRLFCKPYPTKKFYLSKCLDRQEKSIIFVGEFWAIKIALSSTLYCDAKCINLPTTHGLKLSTNTTKINLSIV